MGDLGEGAVRLAVLGSPISHSLSPTIHHAAYDVLGLRWQYERYELTAHALHAFLSDHSHGWRGFSLTMPLKEEAFRIASVTDPVALESSVVNTLLRVEGDRGRWAGFNTDVAGLAAAIRCAGLDAGETVVFGSGATAVSAILAARRLGARRVQLVGRRMSALSGLVTRFDGSCERGSGDSVQVSAVVFPQSFDTVTSGVVCSGGEDPDDVGVFASQATLVISTIPGPAGADVEVSEQLLKVPLFDVAYDPWPSPLATRWRAAGGQVVSGRDMLVQQALIQLRIFLHGDPGKRIDAEDRVLHAMRQALESGDERTG